jgi:hypothetical protein
MKSGSAPHHVSRELMGDMRNGVALSCAGTGFSPAAGHSVPPGEVRERLRGFPLLDPRSTQARLLPLSSVCAPPPGDAVTVVTLSRPLAHALPASPCFILLRPARLRASLCAVAEGVAAGLSSLGLVGWLARACDAAVRLARGAAEADLGPPATWIGPGAPWPRNVPAPPCRAVAAPSVLCQAALVVGAGRGSSGGPIGAVQQCDRSIGDRYRARGAHL